MSGKNAKMCLACNAEYDGDIVSSCPNDGTVLISLNTFDPMLNITLRGRYQLNEFIGRGSTGNLYLSQSNGTYVAVRIFTPFPWAKSEDVREWMLRGKRLVRLEHPNIVRMLDFGIESDGVRFAVYEFVEPDLQGVDVVRTFSDACDALQYAHNQETLHGDLKPTSLISVSGKTMLSDFEFSRTYGTVMDSQTKCQDVELGFGNALYASPEQVMNKPLRVTADLYSLAVCLFQALTGNPPFRGVNVIQTASKHLTDPVPMPFGDVRDGFFQKALAKKAEQRYQSALEFKEALQSFPR
jgi:serine/threonine protein kinase